MQGAIGRAAAAVFLVVMVSACTAKEPNLLNLKADNAGPDEFLILPTKPLQSPDDFTALPAPTPGGTNRADPTPRADAIEALGGNGDRVNRSGLYSGEQALVSYASRKGVAGNIREQLASEDLDWRRRNNGRLLERLFNVSVYFKAYRAMSLDQHGELARLRRQGVWTPAAPPEGPGSN